MDREQDMGVDSIEYGAPAVNTITQGRTIHYEPQMMGTPFAPREGIMTGRRLWDNYPHLNDVLPPDGSDDDESMPPLMNQWENDDDSSVDDSVVDEDDERPQEQNKLEYNDEPKKFPTPYHRPKHQLPIPEPAPADDDTTSSSSTPTKCNKSNKTNNNETSDDDSIHSCEINNMVIPPGSLFDEYDRAMSPKEVRDFPEFKFPWDRKDEADETDNSGTEDSDAEDSILDSVYPYQSVDDNVVYVNGRSRVIGLNGEPQMYK